MTLAAIEIAHRAGPITERIAAAAHTESGARQRNLDRVVALVAARPGSTASQLAGDIDVYEIRRRLTDAKRLGLVTQGPMAHHGRRPEMTWYPIEQQGVLL